MLFSIVIAQHGDRFVTIAHYVHTPQISTDAVIAILHTLRVFSHPSNRIALEQELSFLSSLGPDDPMADYQYTPADAKRRAPFPFIHTCLYLGMKGTIRDSIEMEWFGAMNFATTSRTPSEILLELYSILQPSQSDCDTAIIDITDLDRLKYGFAANDHEIEDALTYLARFSNRAPAKTEQEALIDQSVTLALAKFEVIKGIRVLPGHLPFHKLIQPAESSERDVPRRSAVKSLTNLCIAKLPNLFQSTKTFGITGHEVLDLPHIITSIWEYCVENASTLAKASDHVSAGVLALALKGKTYINLAPFHDLAPAAVRAVLRSFPKARTVNLSGTAAMADHEVEETLAAIDHDLNALYLLTPPGHVVEKLPKGIMRALKNWNHRCSKVLISSLLAEGPIWEMPKRFPPSGVLFPLVWSSTHCVSSRSFPITQVIYQSTFNISFGSHSRPILAHIFLGGGLVAPFRLWTSILRTIKDMHLNRSRERLDFVRFLIHNLALGPPTPGSEDYLEVRPIPMEASFAAYHQAPVEAVYSNPGYHMCDLTPEAWTAVVLRDEIPKDSLPEAGFIGCIHTNRFRVVLLRPKQAIPVGESQFISRNQFEVMVPTLSPNPHSSTADHADGPYRTVLQFQVGLHDMIDAITAVQKVLDAAAALRDGREKLKLGVRCL